MFTILRLLEELEHRMDQDVTEQKERCKERGNTNSIIDGQNGGKLVEIWDVRQKDTRGEQDGHNCQLSGKKNWKLGKKWVWAGLKG